MGQRLWFKTDMMRFSLLIIFLLSALPVIAQEKGIDDIQAYCASIDADLKMDITELKKSEFMNQSSSRDSKLYGYFKGDQLKKIVVQLGMMYSDRTITYYFNGGQMVKAIYDFKKFDPETKKGEEKSAYHGEFFFIQEYLFNQVESGKWMFDNPINDRSSIINIHKNYYKGKLLGK